MHGQKNIKLRSVNVVSFIPMKEIWPLLLHIHDRHKCLITLLANTLYDISPKQDIKLKNNG